MNDITAILSGLVKLARPKQWVKNFFVFAPLLFSGLFLSPDDIGSAVLAFLYFCLAASACYAFNDIQDVESDRLHPTKSKSRPLAAGSVSKRQAWTLMTLLYLGAFTSWLIDPKLAGALTAYMILNIAYSTVLKHQPVLDIFCIALGFVLRVVAGGLVLSLPLSSWMLITTMVLALYLAAMKRRQEMISSGSQARDSLSRYSVQVVERFAEVSATCTLMFYSMYTLSDRPELSITVPLVLYGLFRYYFVVDSRGIGESPADVLFADYHLQICIVLWIVLCMLVIP